MRTLLHKHFLLRVRYWLIALILSFCGTRTNAASPDLIDYLHACGIGADDFARFSDDRQIADEELDVIRRIAVRLRDCPTDSLRTMMTVATAGSDVTAARGVPVPAEAKTARGRPVKLQGRIESIEPARETTAAAAAVPLWRCAITSVDLPHRAVIYVAGSPSAGRGSRFSKSVAVGEQVAIAGLFVKFVPGMRDEMVPVLVAPRLERRAAGPLGGLDFDRELLDGVLDNSPLAAAESGAFYRLLVLAKAAGASRLWREASVLDAPAAASIFRDPAAERGRLVRVAGIARRAVRVPIDDPALAVRLGADHYYEIDLVSDALQDNPLVFCTLDPPPGMPLGEPASYGANVEVAGFLLKTWQYPTALTASEQAAHPEAAQALQTAPLLVGPASIWIPAPAAKGGSPGWVLGGFVVLVMIGLGLLLLHLRQSDQEFSRHLR